MADGKEDTKEMRRMTNDEGKKFEETRGPSIRGGRRMAAPEGINSRQFLIVDIAMSGEINGIYGCQRRKGAERISLHLENSRQPHLIPLFPEWVCSFPYQFHMSSQGISSPTAWLVAYPEATHIRRKACLDELPPILFDGYYWDLRELYTRLGAVRDEIFSQRYRFRSLERDHKRATRENHDLRRQLVKENRKRLELTDRITRMERRHEFEGGVVDYMRFLIRICTLLNRVASVSVRSKLGRLSSSSYGLISIS
ncbi:hypothetical protein Tco_1323393, partial [Tanacetum coccineum]